MGTSQGLLLSDKLRCTLGGEGQAPCTLLIAFASPYEHTESAITSYFKVIIMERTLTERQDQQVGSPDEVAFEMGWISKPQLQARAEQFGKNTYGAYLTGLAR